MSFGEFEDINPSEYANLDKLSLNNLNVREKKLSLFKKKVSHCGAFFPYTTKIKNDAIAELAIKEGFPTGAFLNALDRIIIDYDKFPSFKVVAEVTKSFSGKGFKSEKESDRDIYSRKETIEYLKIKKEFISLLGADKLKPFTMWWLKKYFDGLTNDVLEKFNLSWELYERCALFDWKDTGPTKNYDRIIQTGRNKQDALKHRKQNNPRAYKRIN